MANPTYNETFCHERQGNPLLWQSQQLHPSSALDSPVVPQQVSAMESSTEKIPPFFVTGKEALLESQIIQPETAGCFGGLFI